MKILVTGGAGFIGSHISDKLLTKGHEVVCIDNLSTGNIKNMEDSLKNDDFSFIDCDIRDSNKLKDIFKTEEFDQVYHLAAVVGVKRVFEYPEEVLDVNIDGTVNIFKHALDYGCKKVINISSSEVYGEPIEVPEREDSPKNVDTPYALSKLVCEHYGKIYNDIHGLKTTSLRLFNAYGPRQDSTPYGFVVGIFIDNVLNNQQPVIFGDGFQTRDFTYIKDIVNLIIRSGEISKADGENLNIAAGKPVTILDLAEMVIEITGKDLEPVFEEEREFEIRHRFSDISKMRTLLGYKPKYDIMEGLKLTIDWYMENRK
ncbi:MAG: nucleoside-diphosphate-sugar epimerase [Methanobacterium sp. Maddingley MBC34]|nr:MAG: nucleoside-diphosphate-sugar epimerase [Methanobacterium sp. Maddingley MBC34]